MRWTRNRLSGRVRADTGVDVSDILEERVPRGFCREESVIAEHNAVENRNMST